MRAPAIALVAAVGGALLVPAVPLAEDLPAAPVAALDAADGPVVAGKPVKLDSSRSTGTIADHRWDLDGDGSFETDTGAVATAEATPEAAGPLTVRVRVSDAAGHSDDAERVLDVAAAAPAAAAGDPGMSAAVGAPAPPNGGDAPADPPPAQLAPAAAPPPPSGTHAPGHPDVRPPQRSAHHHPPAAPPPRPDPHAGDEPASAPASLPAAAVPSPVPAASMAAAPLMRPATLYAATAHPRSTATVHAAGASAVAIRNFAFSPGQVTVHVGDTVTWTNSDSAPHTATASDGSFNTGIIKKGASGSHTFSTAGTISYVCSVHPNMHGTVVVAAASGSGGGSGSGSGSTAASGASGGSGSGAGSPSATAAATSGGLPHTGLNLIVVALLASTLTGSGRLLRRIAR